MGKINTRLEISPQWLKNGSAKIADESIRLQCGHVPVLLQCFRVRQRFNVLDRPVVHHIAHGKLDDLAAFGARNVGDLHDFRGNVAWCGVAANLILDFLDQHVVQEIIGSESNFL